MFDFFSSVPFFLFLSVLVSLTKKSEFWNYLVGYNLAQKPDQNPNCSVAEKDARVLLNLLAGYQQKIV